MPIIREVTLACESCGVHTPAVHHELAIRDPPGDYVRVRGTESVAGGVYCKKSSLLDWRVADTLLFCSDFCQDSYKRTQTNQAKEQRLRAVRAIRDLPAREDDSKK